MNLISKMRFKILMIVVMIILVFKSGMVRAGSSDSILEKDVIENVYAVVNYRGEENRYSLNMYSVNQKKVYCLELGNLYITDIYNSTYDFSLSNLSNTKVLYIRNVSYFGYGYINHLDYRYYMASQEIIWEYLYDADVKWINNNGEVMDIESYKIEILDLVNSYKKNISFNNYRNGMDVYIGDSIVLTDNNNSLRFYELVNCEHCVADVKGNNMYIEFDDNYVGKVNVVLNRKQVYDYDGLYFYQDSFQSLISNGNINEEVVLSFNVKGKKMAIQVQDSILFKHNNQFDYSGNRFDLYNSNKRIMQLGLVVSKEGRIFVENMPYGEYYVKQSVYNGGYLLNNVFQKIVFNNNEIIVIDIVPVINEYKFIKLYGEDDSLIAEEGIIFDIYDVDGTLYDSVVTDRYGVADFKLPYGDYIVKQKNSTYGYSKVEDFYIEGKKNYSNVITYTLVDKKAMVNLVINSKDIFNKFILNGEFSYKIKNGGNYLTVDGRSEFKSVNGNVLIPVELGYGEYEVEVINKSSLYKELVNNVKVIIDDNSNLSLKDGKLYLDVDVKYDVVKGVIKVNTYKETFKVKDENFYYDYVSYKKEDLKLIANEDIIVNGTVVYAKGDIVLSFDTDDNGIKEIEDIYFGSYCVGDGNNNCFKVSNEEIVNIDIKDNINKGSVKIHNMSYEFENISRSVFNFYDKDNKLIYRGITNDDGIIELDNLAYDDYCVKQISVLEGFKVNKDKICFSIKDKNVVNVEVVNEKALNKFIKVPNTLDDKKGLNKLIILVFLLLGGIIYKIKSLSV